LIWNKIITILTMLRNRIRCPFGRIKGGQWWRGKGTAYNTVPYIPHYSTSTLYIMEAAGGLLARIQLSVSWFGGPPKHFMFFSNVAKPDPPDPNIFVRPGSG
jgi:hypothetical protein